jgi:DNA-binding NtrC family response regulator
VLGPAIVLDGAVGPASPAAPSGDLEMPPNLLNLIDDSGHTRPLEEIEAEAIKFALSHYRNQMSEVARRLHIGRSTLYRKLDSLGLAVAGDTDA